MQKITFKKLSMLALVLLAASAVTAAILPNAKSNAQTPFSLSAQTNDGSASTESCMRTVNATDDPCADDTATDAWLSGSTSYDFFSDGATTL